MLLGEDVTILQAGVGKALIEMTIEFVAGKKEYVMGNLVYGVKVLRDKQMENL